MARLWLWRSESFYPSLIVKSRTHSTLFFIPKVIFISWILLLISFVPAYWLNRRVSLPFTNVWAAAAPDCFKENFSLLVKKKKECLSSLNFLYFSRKLLALWCCFNFRKLSFLSKSEIHNSVFPAGKCISPRITWQWICKSKEQCC